MVVTQRRQTVNSLTGKTISLMKSAYLAFIILNTSVYSTINPLKRYLE